MTPAAFSFARVGAMVLRYSYLLRSSWPRLLDLVYWPAVQMLMWGFLQVYIAQNAGFFARAGGTFIGAVLLWDMLFRGQLGFALSFLEEMWSRNFANLMISPLRPVEFVLALMIMSLVRLAISAVPVALLAIAFFGFNLFGLGLALAAFFVNLMLTSWSIGMLVSGLVLRNGLGAENLAWTIMFIFLPLTCVYYPIAVLPAWLQHDRLDAAADLRIRGHARTGHRPRFSRRSHDRGARAQRGFLRHRRRGLSRAAAKRPPQRRLDAGRRVTAARSGVASAVSRRLPRSALSGTGWGTSGLPLCGRVALRQSGATTVPISAVSIDGMTNRRQYVAAQNRANGRGAHGNW